MKTNGKSSKSIITLAGEFKEAAELKEYCNKQYEFIENLTNEVARLKDENTHLKSLLTGSIPVINTHVIKLPDEEMICLEQIKKLKDVASIRELSLDEVKKLDLLHKNLKMSREGSQDLPKTFKKKEYSNAQLIEIASKKEKE